MYFQFVLFSKDRRTCTLVLGFHKKFFLSMTACVVSWWGWPLLSVAGWDARLLHFPSQLDKVCSATVRVVLTQSDFLWSSTRDPILKTTVYWESSMSKDSKRRVLERLQQKDSCSSWIGDGNTGLWCCRSHPNINVCTLRPVFNLGQRWILKCFLHFFCT